MSRSDTSIPITSFKRAFERNLNRDMRPDRPVSTSYDSDSNLKKHHDATSYTANEDEEEDIEMSEKKDRPPRFSTVFGGAAAASTPAPIMIEPPSPRRREKNRGAGVFIPMPLFILLAALLFLESTFLFAYTIIGLYNNRPSGILPLGSSTSPSPLEGGGCNCADRQSGINIAPNFVLPAAAQAHEPVTITTTLSPSTKTVVQTTTFVTTASPPPVETTTVLSTSIVDSVVTGSPLSTVVSLKTVLASSSAASSSTQSTTSVSPSTTKSSVKKAVTPSTLEGNTSPATTLKATSTQKTTSLETTTAATSSSSAAAGGLTLCDPITPECAASKDVVPGDV